jgi:hypothetical protein
MDFSLGAISLRPRFPYDFLAKAMERLYKVTGTIKNFFLASALALVTQAARAQGYCSLKVEVTSPGGGNVAAQVFVEERNGNVEYRLLKGHEVTFCDLGILPVTVKVGVDGSCSQVVVRNVALMWQRESTLKVTFDPGGCPKDAGELPTPVCLVLFRVTDPGSRPAQGAHVRFVDGKQPVDLTTDQYGRAAYSADLDGAVPGVVEASGAERHFSFRCTRADYHQPGVWLHEENIKLPEKTGK